MKQTTLYHYAELSTEAQEQASRILSGSEFGRNPIWDQYRDAAEDLSIQAMTKLLNWPDPIAFQYLGPEDYGFRSEYPDIPAEVPCDAFWGPLTDNSDRPASVRIQEGFENLIAQAEDYIAEFDWSAYFDEHNVLFYEDGQPTVKL